MGSIGGTFKGLLGQEGGVPMNGISDLIKETPESSPMVFLLQQPEWTKTMPVAPLRWYVSWAEVN